MQNANLVSPRGWAACVLAAALAVTGCGSGTPASADEGTKGIEAHFTVAVDGHPASIQVAILPSEQERGLMQRPDLGKDEGMIFINAAPQRLSFWMRNTPEPLDVAYIDADGVVVELYPLLPLDERPVNSHSSRLKFALEMPSGWFAANGVRSGARIDMAAVAAAVKARGFEPEKFGIR